MRKSQKSQNSEKLEKESPLKVLRFLRKLRKTAKIAEHWKAREGKSPNSDEMVYEMNHIWTADMKSSEAMIFALMNAIFTIA